MNDVTMPLTRRAVVGALAAGVALVRPTAGRAQPSAVGSEGSTAMRIRATFNGTVLTATLEDNPSARDLLSLLPFEGTIEDFSDNEKIAYLPRRLTEEGSGPFGDEAPGDLCYWAPWGNLAFFYAGYRYSKGLIRLGRLDGIGPLAARGAFPVRVERIP